MRVALLALTLTLNIAWLASVDAAVSRSVPGAGDQLDYQPIAEGCGYGWHWMGGHADRAGAWVAGRCQSDH
jgi:hypothetical protein